MYKPIVAAVLLFFLAGCERRPNYNDMVQHFETHRSEFNEIARLACEIGAREKLRTNIENLSHQDLKALLKSIDVESISHKEHDGNCSLRARYYGIAFGGSGWIQEYAYNLPSPLPYDEAFHSPEAINERNQDEAFDMFLGDGWYFSLRSN